MEARGATGSPRAGPVAAAAVLSSLRCRACRETPCGRWPAKALTSLGLFSSEANSHTERCCRGASSSPLAFCRSEAPVKHPPRRRGRRGSAADDERQPVVTGHAGRLPCNADAAPRHPPAARGFAGPGAEGEGGAARAAHPPRPCVLSAATAVQSAQSVWAGGRPCDRRRADGSLLPGARAARRAAPHARHAAPHARGAADLSRGAARRKGALHRLVRRPRPLPSLRPCAAPSEHLSSQRYARARGRSRKASCCSACTSRVARKRPWNAHW